MRGIPLGLACLFAFAVAIRGETDFGDAPAPYPVTNAADGARHTIGAGWFLGAAVDGETDGQPDTDAEGDDRNGVNGDYDPDDEDGVFLRREGSYEPLGTGTVVQIGAASVLGVVASTGGALNAWIDLNIDGDWSDPGEHFGIGVLLHAGTNEVILDIPPTATNGTTFARFRFASEWSLGVTGATANGEVEDYAICLARLEDLGDAPAPYPVTVAADGARHTFVSNWFLGTTIDTEDDGQPSADALGDDNNGAGGDDEDGVFVLRGGSNVPLDSVDLLQVGATSLLSVVASQYGVLNAWIDFNIDGDWLDPGEHFKRNVLTLIGTNEVKLAVPSSVTGGTTYARFRFGSQAGLSFTGPAANGEVEDYAVELARLEDFGDAPVSYPVTLAADGARHTFVSNWYMGAIVDSEDDGQPSANALGDDQGGPGGDDEDGVLVWRGGSYVPLDGEHDFQVNATQALAIVTSGPGRLDAWFDFNADGDWFDGGERVFTGLGTIDVTNIVSVGVPMWASNAQSFARFRFSAQGGLAVTGLAANGEVEDYAIRFTRNIDYGDAPVWYPTLLANDGARHLISPDLRLGAAIDGEDDGQPSADADEDDRNGEHGIYSPDDEDGVLIRVGGQYQPLGQGHVLRAGGTYGLGVVGSSGGILNGWVDFSGDGDWYDDGEHVVSNLTLMVGTNEVALQVPLETGTGLSYARFRLSSQPGLSVTGFAANGEVEDYGLQIVCLKDFGDAPDQYPTLADDDGAWHLVITGFHLGNVIDSENDGQPGFGAQGDDRNGLNGDFDPDDEDGVLVRQGDSYEPLDTGGELAVGVTSRLAVVASTGGMLNAWVDLNIDADWADAAEHVLNGVPLIAGTNEIGLYIPPEADAGKTYARFRFGSEMALPATGAARDGEVEDYFVELIKRYDFGDAPQHYRTLANDDGARHLVRSGLFLGQMVDHEDDGQPSADALDDDRTGAGGDDEDGVLAWRGDHYEPLAVNTPLQAGATHQLGVVASGAGKLNAWVDLNAAGDWSDPGEWFASNVVLSAGTNQVMLPVPASAVAGTTFARFRFGSQADLSVTGAALDGEVEDYAVELTRLSDFGDAPVPYPTRLSDDGARHLVGSGRYLGANIDAESDGNPGTDADDDDRDGVNGEYDPDDEDGVLVWRDDHYEPLSRADPLQAKATRILGVVASTGGYLSVWIDLDLDGVWEANGEHVFDDVQLVPGTNVLALYMPLATSNGLSYARFRFSAQTNLAVTGAADDGEVEDYAVELTRWSDFGDAPASYSTRLSDNGARHLLVSGWQLGAAIDGESDGQPGTEAGDDDRNGVNGDYDPDDEDGVLIRRGDHYEPLSRSDPLQARALYDIAVVASTGGYLNVWIDLDRNGNWGGAGEQVFDDLPLVAGTNTLALHMPAATSNGVSYARFRFSSQMDLAFTGSADDGEVEDYVVELTHRSDFGDAPDSYPTRLSNNGARHLLVSGWQLGAAIDGESDGQPDANADEDDRNGLNGEYNPDDEDGVLVWRGNGYVPLGQGRELQAGATYSLGVVASTAGYLNAWIDLDRNGDWNGTGEQIADDVLLVRGTNAVSLPVPATTGEGPSYSRFRFGSQSNLSDSGWADDGEVEDHMVELTRRLDFGDARESYPVRLSDDGARHLVVSGWSLGQVIDFDLDGQPDDDAQGDDRNGLNGDYDPDDEDGVFVWNGSTHVYDALSYASLPSVIPQKLGVVASTSGVLNAWMDFDGDGWGGPGDHIFTNVPLTAGTNELTLRLPGEGTNRTVYARFRFGSQTGLTYTGPADDGEVEDYALINERKFDFGDAPGGYPTELRNNGARHLIMPGWYLGSGVDAEDDWATGEEDDHTGADDEDGAFVLDPDTQAYLPLDAYVLRANVKHQVAVVASTAGFVNAWIDFEANGRWDGEGEHFLDGVAVTPGTNTFELLLPDTQTNATSYARFRFGPEADVDEGGRADGGEVEDYNVEFLGAVWILGLHYESSGTTTVKWVDVGMSYTLEYTTNLVQPGWRPVQGDWPSGTNEWRGPAPATNVPVYFRVTYE